MRSLALGRADCCHGLPLAVSKAPPRFSSVVYTQVSLNAAAVLREEIETLLCKQAIRVVPQADAQRGWYSRYFVVPKRGGGLRPIMDLRTLNKHLRVFKFRMLTLRQFLRAVGPGDWFTSIDLTDAYFHIAVHPDHRRYLRFAFEGVAYEWLVLPFGLSLAPRTFTKCVEAALAPLRMRGVRVLSYLDDLALIGRSRDEALAHTGAVLSHIQRLGFSVNLKKSSLIPSQKLSFLGLEICSLTSRARLSERRICAFRDCLAQFQLARSLRFRQFLQLLGQMASMIAVVPLGLLLMRAFQHWLLSHRLNASHHLQKKIVVTQGCMKALSPWREPRLLCQGSPIGRVLFRVVVSTDASLTGWGAVCNGAAVKGAWSSAQRSLHINCLELLAFHLSLKRFLSELRGKHVLVRTDNTTVVSYINRQGARGHSCF
uniref:ribonuclease H n=1 Tax=Astyanax mexicanus TaxID=7994 RepID=A0A3B1IRS8_ASTMX